MFHDLPSLPGRSDGEAFDETMEQVDAAERLGLDVMWLAFWGRSQRGGADL